MGDSYRIRTEVGTNQTINVNLEQDFEFLEILSLKIQQADVYTRSCADYGVVVGRVFANGGFGVPNAKVSVFIPVESFDRANPIINNIYPYQNVTDKNEDGYRYNLLPSEKSYSTHEPTGTFPSRLDVLTGMTEMEIYDKYYRFTCRTNDSGDYMIMGVPLGFQTLVMDIDLSDIGEFSLTPQDLIRMGIATETQVAGNKFRASNDLNSLPQILNLTRSLEIFPLWGDPDICQITINRADFDLRNDASIEIQPTSIFMGSMFSSPDKQRVRPAYRVLGINITRDSRPKDNLGNLCDLQTNTGQILAIRQTIFQDQDGNPVLEEYRLEQSGNIIDGDGTWLTELPMNLDYITTNEFGEKVISYDPEIGIPTSAKYRFKIKWQQPSSLQIQTRRAYYLVPNIKEYGWLYSNFDINFSASQIQKRQQKSSYYFGLSWSGYTDGFTGTQQINRLNEIINCEDTFYEFKFNKVYTIASFIDQFKNGNRGRFIGIKEIDDDDCQGEKNKFPVNEGVKNFDLFYFLFSTIIRIVQIVLIGIVIGLGLAIFGYSLVFPIGTIIVAALAAIWALNFNGITLPMISYPDCEVCETEDEGSAGTNITIDDPLPPGDLGSLTNFSIPIKYKNSLITFFTNQGIPQEELDGMATITSQALAGNTNNEPEIGLFKLPKSDKYLFNQLTAQESKRFAFSDDLTLGERINIFNGRNSFFNKLNVIKVTFDKPNNIGKFHLDNTLTVISPNSYQPGDLLCSIYFGESEDKNFFYTAITNNEYVQHITGTPTSNQSTINVKYAATQLTENTISYDLSAGTTINRQQFPMDIEYFQVVTAITINDAIGIWDNSEPNTFPNILTSKTKVKIAETFATSYTILNEYEISPLDQYDGFGNQFILILQRGVDPYSPLFENEYKLGKIFGKDIDDNTLTVSVQTRINVPIQGLNSDVMSVQQYNQTNMFYPSHFFQPGDGFSAFTTTTTGLYGRIDSSYNQTNHLINLPIQDNVIAKVSAGYNRFYNDIVSSVDYGYGEDLSGLGFMMGLYPEEISLFFYEDITMEYFSPVFYNQQLNVSDKTKNILRTDRLPSSDGLDGASFGSNVGLLQQNNYFRIYVIGEGEITTPPISTSNDIDQIPQDIEGLPNSLGILESFSCSKMVDLNCYEGFGDNFRIKPGCQPLKGGYTILKNMPYLIPIGDIGRITEWAFRLRFFYALCRGVLSQTFTNNWVNGTLFAFPIQINNFYNSSNQVSETTYPRNLIYFDKDTFNFYYRSSPYRLLDNEFIGKSSDRLDEPLNKKNLLFPTTIIDLGMKDPKYSEITLDPYTKAYIMPQIPATSYDDTSDLVNLYVISRIGNSSFLTQLFQGINSLFKRDGRRVGADLTQMMSINSEVGVIKFSPEYYESLPNDPNSPTRVLGTESYPTIAVWYSSTTEDLQVKDYLTPGVINFRPQNTTQNYPFRFGIKSQRVPFYQWQTRPTNPVNIFGNEFNNWSTDDYYNGTGIFSKNYQSLYRVDTPPTSYFQSNTIPNSDIYKRGYIFSTDAFGRYSQRGSLSQSFLVGAPFHFYFGVNTGFSALDKFKTKYLADE